MSKASFVQIRDSFIFISPLQGDKHAKRINPKYVPESTNDSSISTESEDDNRIIHDENITDRKESKKTVLPRSYDTLDEKEKSEGSYPAHTKLEDVQNGKHTLRSIKSFKNPIKYHSTSGLQEHSSVALIKNNYQRTEEGLLEMVNTEINQKQKEATGKIAKQLGTAIFSKKTISLPVSIFEPQTMLEKVALTFVYAPSFLERAVRTMDKFEQFKLTLSFWVASLHTNVWLYKPFNPILGETFQGYINDAPVYVEQVSHHPPICCYQMYGNQFKIQGSYEAQANTSTNGFKTKNFGYPQIRFENTNVNITAFQPTFQVTGTMFGKKTYSLSHKLVVVDFENQLYAEIEFDNDGGGFWGKDKKLPKDSFVSAIWKVNSSFLERLKKEMQGKKDLGSKFKPKEDAIEKLETIEGSWLTNLKIAERVYWGFGDDHPALLHKITNALPSDSTFRPDVLHLKVNNSKAAQLHKEELESVQRRDRKLREKK